MSISPNAKDEQNGKVIEDSPSALSLLKQHSARSQSKLVASTQDTTGDIETGYTIAGQCPIAADHHQNDADDNDDADFHFQKACRFVARMGWYACHYGATPSRVEVLMQDLMNRFGYTGSLFRITNGELFCFFCRDEKHIFDDQTMRMFELKEGLHLHRLGLLNELCKQVCQGKVTQSQALDSINCIAQEPDPWGFWTFFLSSILVGATVPAILQGTWWDSLGGAVCSLPVYFLARWLPALYQKALPLLSAFVSALVAIALHRLWIPDLQVALVVLSAVIIQVPGYWVSLAVSEIITNHITAGVGRLVNALVTLGLLVGGYWLAVNVLDIFDSSVGGSFSGFAVDPSVIPQAIPVLWQVLVFAPCLMVSLCIQFQTSPSDCPWSFMNLMLAYGTSYAATLVAGKRNVSVLVASMVVTIFAQAWAQWKDRPRSIVITPALVVLVGGSIGFRGLVTLTVDDNPEAGLQEFAQMFVVALLIMAGLLIGNLLWRAPTTL